MLKLAWLNRSVGTRIRRIREKRRGKDKLHNDATENFSHRDVRQRCWRNLLEPFWKRWPLSDYSAHPGNYFLLLWRPSRCTHTHHSWSSKKISSMKAIMKVATSFLRQTWEAVPDTTSSPQIGSHFHVSAQDPDDTASEVRKLRSCDVTGILGVNQMLRPQASEVVAVLLPFSPAQRFLKGNQQLERYRWRSAFY